MIGIYKITSPSGKIYIGQSVNIKKRFYAYNSNSSKEQPRLHNSFMKYGVKNHLFEIIELADFDLLNERERYWQEYYDVIGLNGLNCQLTNTKEKKIKVSEYTKNKHKKRCGENHQAWGKKRTEEQRKRMSEAQKGIKRPPLTEKTKKKISVRMMGNKVWVGRTHKESTLKKMSLNSASKKTILDFNTGIYYDSLTEFCNLNNLELSTTLKQIKGLRKKNKFPNIKIV